MKRVQEISVNGGDPPSRYIRKEVEDGPTDDDGSTVSSSIPIIDLSILSSDTNLKEKEEEMEKLRSALASWGLFQAIGHGIPSTLLDKVRKMAKEFFDLPVEEKDRYSRAGGDDDLEGYGNDNIISDDQILDWSDRLYLLVKPLDQRKLKIWPENPKSFREILHEYSIKTSMVAEVVLKGMAKSVGLEENCFISQFGEQAPMFARFNYYPPCSRPDLVYGLKPHADGSGITIVLQDKEVEGLQVLKDGKWIEVPIIPHALLVSIADQMEIMSNGMFKSPVHKAVTNSKKERLSLAMFYSSQFDKEIEPAHGLIDETRPRLFRKVKVKDFVDVFFTNYLQGKRAIDWAKA